MAGLLACILLYAFPSRLDVTVTLRITTTYEIDAETTLRQALLATFDIKYILYLSNAQGDIVQHMLTVAGTAQDNGFTKDN